MLFVFHIDTNNLGKEMNLNILSPAIGKIVGQTGFFNVGMQPVKEKENSEFKPVKIRSE